MTGRDHTADVAAVLAGKHVSDGDPTTPECRGCRENCLYCEGHHPWPCEVVALLASEPIAQALAAVEAVARAEAERGTLAAAVDRVRRRHPRGDEESGLLAPGLWCPTCGRERTDGGFGGCPDRNSLSAALRPEGGDQ